MVAGFCLWLGIRFRLVGITSFTALVSAVLFLALRSSYNPGAGGGGVVTGHDRVRTRTNLVVATACGPICPPRLLPHGQNNLALNLPRPMAAFSPMGLVHVRLRRVNPWGPGSQPAR